jgi:hypothetical protein
MGKAQPPHGPGGVDERIAPLVAVPASVGELPATDTVKDYENDLLRGRMIVK